MAKRSPTITTEEWQADLTRAIGAPAAGRIPWSDDEKRAVVWLWGQGPPYYTVVQVQKALHTQFGHRRTYGAINKKIYDLGASRPRSNGRMT